MTLYEIVKMFREEKPNKVSDAHVVQWINECEDEVQNMLNIPQAEWVSYTTEDIAEGTETEPVVPRPYQKLYLFWLQARLDYANQEYEGYSNNWAQCKAQLDAFNAMAIREQIKISKLPTNFKNIF